jgi:hypothetical protein
MADRDVTLSGAARARHFGRLPLGRDLFLLLILVLSFLFFVTHANLSLTTDDMAWLRGQASTVYDRYRIIPRGVFVSLHALFGPEPIPALGTIFAFHALNGLLVYHLGRRWLDGGLSIAALAAAAAFAINPITFQTLTWISCFSYVLGTTLALLALLAFWRAAHGPGGRSLGWAAAALACYAAGLLSSHEVFFLPAVFLLLGWWQGRLRLGLALCAAGMALAIAVNAFVYDFGRYGVDAARLFSLDFALAYASSGLAAGVALAVAYPLSFLGDTVGFLQFCLSEPVRWSITTGLLAAGLLRWRRGPLGRRERILALSFLCLISPYVIRLYLTPDAVSFHASYVLSGRVYYLAFVPVALALGQLAGAATLALGRSSHAWLALLLPVSAYTYALWHYDRVDYLGLDVIHSIPASVPQRWNPYAVQHPAWLLVPVVALFAVVWVRVWRSRTT